MLLNNLDAEVAEHPERLVVYGGSGRGGAEPRGASTGIVRALLQLGDDETLLVQSGKAGGRLPYASRRASRADRERAAGAAVGDLGGVPPARGARADDVRADDGRELDLHRDAGDPPGHVPDVRGCRRDALRLAGSRRPDDPDGRSRRDGRRPATGRDDGRRGDPLRRGRSVAHRAAPGDRVPRRGGGVPRRGRRTSSRELRPNGGRCRLACSATPRSSTRSSPVAGSSSTSSRTRRPHTTPCSGTSRASFRSRKRGASGSAIRMST